MKHLPLGQQPITIAARSHRHLRRHGRMRDAGNRARALDHPFERLHDARTFEIFVARKCDAAGDHASRLEARMDGVDRKRTANQQSGSDQQQQRERHFRRDEHAAQPIA